MKNNQRVIYGLGITLAIFVIASFVGSKLSLGIDFIPFTFVNHSVMLLLSFVAIYSLKSVVNYKISLPKLKRVFKPIILALLATIIVNVFMNILTILLKGEIETHFALKTMSPLQVFIFVFIYASIAEEILFRGFLMNILKPLASKKISLFKREISLPVIFSALLFGLAHLTLITTGAGGLFLLRILIFTTTLGLIAGYYQEKYDNNAFAIIVHMSGNILGVVGALLINANV